MAFVVNVLEARCPHRNIELAIICNDTIFHMKSNVKLFFTLANLCPSEDVTLTKNKNNIVVLKY
jgi:hypothetical protein